MLPKLVSESGRKFTCFPAAILLFLINDDEEVLLFSKRPRQWSVITGAIEDNETILKSAERELHEETGGGIEASPIGVVHTHSFHHDSLVRNLISIHYVMHYKGGKVVPSDDEKGSIFEWWSLDNVKNQNAEIIIPKQQPWVFERAIFLFRNYNGVEVPLEYFKSSE